MTPTTRVSGSSRKQIIAAFAADELATIENETASMQSRASAAAMARITATARARAHASTAAAEAAAAAAAATATAKMPLSRATATGKIMSYQYMVALLVILLLSGPLGVNGLKCYMCGQYNEGVGSITPCLNYSEKLAHHYLKECNKKSEKFCVKYVSELSTVRDCASECVEKEIWETQTYCCKEEGCNGASTLTYSYILLALPLVYYIWQSLASDWQLKR